MSLGCGAPIITVAKSTEELYIVNQAANAIVKNGYYEVNGFKISEYYFTKLWNSGRGGSTLVVKEILKDVGIMCVPDSKKAGFYRYTYHGWELVYNPITKEILHILPIK